MFPDFKAPSTSGSGGLCSLFGVLHIPFSELLLLFRPSISGHKPPFFSTTTCLLIVIYVITTHSSGIIIAVQSFTAVYTKRMIFLSQMLPNNGQIGYRPNLVSLNMNQEINFISSLLVSRLCFYFMFLGTFSLRFLLSSKPSFNSSEHEVMKRSILGKRDYVRNALVSLNLLFYNHVITACLFLVRGAGQHKSSQSSIIILDFKEMSFVMAPTSPKASLSLPHSRLSSMSAFRVGLIFQIKGSNHHVFMLALYMQRKQKQRQYPYYQLASTSLSEVAIDFFLSFLGVRAHTILSHTHA